MVAEPDLPAARNRSVGIMDLMRSIIRPSGASASKSTDQGLAQPITEQRLDQLSQGQLDFEDRMNSEVRQAFQSLDTFDCNINRILRSQIKQLHDIETSLKPEHQNHGALMRHVVFFRDVVNDVPGPSAARSTRRLAILTKA